MFRYLPGKTRSFRISQPVAVPLMRHTLAVSRAVWPLACHKLFMVNNERYVPLSSKNLITYRMNKLTEVDGHIFEFFYRHSFLDKSLNFQKIKISTATHQRP